MNILICEDSEKENVQARIKEKGSCTKYIGGVDDYEVYPNGYYAEMKLIPRNKSGIMRNFE